MVAGRRLDSGAMLKIEAEGGQSKRAKASIPNDAYETEARRFENIVVCRDGASSLDEVKGDLVARPPHPFPSCLRLPMA